MNGIGQAHIEMDGKTYNLPEISSHNALQRLAGQKVTGIESIEEERFVLRFSNGAILAFVFEPDNGEWRPVWQNGSA